MDESISLAQIYRMPGKDGIRDVTQARANPKGAAEGRLRLVQLLHIYNGHALSHCPSGDSIPETNILMQRNMIIYK